MNCDGRTPPIGRACTLRARRVLEWGISSLSFVRPSVLPSAFRASSLRLEAEGRQRMFDPRRGTVVALLPSVGRPAPAVVQARACTEATSMATVPSSARPRMRQRKCCCVGAKMGQGDGDGRRDGAEGRCLGRAPLESVEVVTVSETLSLKEKESAPRTCTPQGEMEERARAGNAAIDREGRCPLG